MARPCKNRELLPTYRLHIAIDLINLSLHQVEVTTDKEGENLDYAGSRRRGAD